MKEYVYALCLMILPMAVWAQIPEPDSPELLTLEEVWKIAAAQNRHLLLADLNRQESKIAILEAKDKLLPELTLAGDFRLNSKFLIYDNGLFSSPQDVPISKYGYAAGYHFNLNLYNGGKDRRAVRIKEEEELHRQYEFDLQRNNVNYAIAVAYYDLYKFLQFRDFITAEIAAEKKQLSTIESLNRNGIVLKSDVLRTSLKLSQMELSFSDVSKKIEIASQRLNTLMGREAEQSVAIPYRELLLTDSIKNTGYPEYMDVALNNSPELKIASSEIRISELTEKQTRSARLPKVSLYSDYNYTYPQVSFYPYSNALWGYGQTGVRMQFSLDNLYKSKHSIAHARTISLQQKEKAGIRKDEISLQVKEAYLQQIQASESVETAEKNIAQSTETVRVIRNSYLNQESLLTDLLDAENVLLEARFSLTSALVNLKLSHIRLLAITGTL
ncbi:TolC family protein [Chryseobacterium pennipullorum]|uniref:TolC family protein n=1 Tax=Chryseobacterium pennipullorum TaxID=2258963 RepID=A0A3D9B2C7_9FLAO|nr:TolC family protein [Chryseobacterium pennipullorum]REC47497.1 TolC family protein [Chryseobacterium pennipullorum]